MGGAMKRKARPKRWKVKRQRAERHQAARDLRAAVAFSLARKPTLTITTYREPWSGGELLLTMPDGRRITMEVAPGETDEELAARFAMAVELERAGSSSE
jgi:hypothetical protein